MRAAPPKDVQSPPKNEGMNKLFKLLMMFVGLMWLWTIALFKLWPWASEQQWQTGYPVLALCKQADTSKTCTLGYGELAQARAEQRIESLIPAAPRGEMQEEQLWVKWATQDSLYELTLSTWFAEEGVRYRLENGEPQLLAHRLVDISVFWYALPIALINVLLIVYIRRKTEAPQTIPTTF